MPPRYSRQAIRETYSKPPDVAKALKEAKEELEKIREKTERRISRAEEERAKRAKELQKLPKSPQKTPRASFESGRSADKAQPPDVANYVPSPPHSPRVSFESGADDQKALRPQAPKASTGSGAVPKNNGAQARQSRKLSASAKSTASRRSKRKTTITPENPFVDTRKRSIGAQRAKRTSRKHHRAAERDEEVHEPEAAAPPKPLPLQAQRPSLMAFGTIWSQLPKLLRSQTKIRGRFATPVRIYGPFRIIAHARFLIMVEVLLCFLGLNYYFLATYQFFFAFEHTSDFKFSYYYPIVDYVYLMEFLFRLIAELFRYHLQLDYGFFYIPTTPKYWIIASIILAPTGYIFQLRNQVDTIVKQRWIDGLRFNRLIILFRIYFLVEYLDQEHYLSEVSAFLVKFISFYVAIIHLITCLIFALTGITSIDILMQQLREGTEGSWLGSCVMLKPEYVSNPSSNYILSGMFTSTIATSVGFGECVPRTALEQVVVIVLILLIPVYIVGYFLSKMTSFYLARDGAKQDLYLRHQVIESQLIESCAPALLIEKIREYYHDCLWNYRQGVYKVHSLRDLPPCMYDDVLFDICSPMFEKSVLLRGLEKPFLTALSKTAEVHLYNPDMIVCERGASPCALFYIIHGECHVSSITEIVGTSAVLRAGCIFGESSLLFAVPYASNVQTKSCCQLLIIRKDKFLHVCQEFPHTMTVVRFRLKTRLKRLHDEYEWKGQYPIEWVQKREEPGSQFIGQEFPEVQLHWAEGLNAPVPESESNDPSLEDTVIVSMVPKHQNMTQRKDHLQIYSRCIVPLTLLIPHPFLQFWHLMIVLLSIVTLVVCCYALTIQFTPDQPPFVWEFANILDAVTGCFFFVDVFVEIMTTTPSSGIWFRFADGLRVKRKQWTFYVDLISGFPLLNRLTVNAMVKSTFPRLILLYFHGCIGRYFKCLYKATRYFEYLGEKYPNNLFLFRLMRLTLYFVLTIALGTSILFHEACPLYRIKDNTCAAISWLRSPYLNSLAWGDGSVMKDQYLELANSNPYLVGTYFSTSSLTTTGFGDFHSQSIVDIVFLFWLQFWGFVTGHFTAKMTSALVALYLAKVRLAENLVALQTFFDVHGTPQRLRERIREHYVLQHKLRRGVVLPKGVQYLMYDAPANLYEDTLFSQVDDLLEGVPIFSQAEPSLLISLATQMVPYLLPPNIRFIRRGEVRRQLYIIAKGSMAILKEDTENVKGILLPSGHFGLRDLLYGEPAFNNIVTLSYCLIYAIDWATFSSIFVDDMDLMMTIVKERENIAERIKALDYIFNIVGTAWRNKERKPTEVPSWIVFPKSDKSKVNVCTFKEFEEGFMFPRWLWRRLLMRRTVHPAGSFALLWCLIITGTSMMTVLLICLILIGHFLATPYRAAILASKVIYALDVYVQLHWGFYTDSNHLICHPMSTAKHYFLEGPFIWTLACDLAPYPLAAWFLGAESIDFSGGGVYWSIRLAVNSIVAFCFRLPTLFQFGHSFSLHRTLKMFLIYLLMAVLVCSILACFAILLVCPWPDNIKWKAEYRDRLPACLPDTWIDTKEYLRKEVSYHLGRWLMAVYYIQQAFLSIGYGDTVTLNPNEMVLMILVMIFGFIATKCVVSDMTATTASGDEIRSEFSEKIRTIKTIMKKHEVDDDTSLSVIEYMERIWLTSRGLQAQELFSNLHPGLQADFFREYIGDLVSKIPIFSRLSENTLRKICTELKRYHFFRGDPISRQGMIELEMYIIVDGDVWIASGKGRHVCTLGPGETFGEVEMMYGMARRYSAIAANYVEVLALDATSFAQILEHYPGLKNHMEARLGGQKENLFERKIHLLERIRLNNLPLGDRVISNAENRISAVIRSVYNFDRSFIGIRNSSVMSELGEYMKPSPKIVQILRRRFLYWGPNDAKLPFFYFASPEGTRKPSLLLHPQCGFQRFHFLLVRLSCLLSPATSIFHIVFVHGRKEDDFFSFLVLTFVLEGIFILHMLLQFFTPFRTVNGLYCKEHRKVAFRYFRTFSRFWLDLFSILPLTIYFHPYTDEHLRYIGFLHLLRLVHYYRSIREEYANIRMTTFRFNLAISLPTAALVCHVFASIFYFISSCTPMTDDSHWCTEGTWTSEYVKVYFEGRMDSRDHASWRWYLRSLYWVIATGTTVGFGDIVPVNLLEVCLAVVLSFCGAFLVAIFFCQFTAGVASLQKYQQEYTYQHKGDVRHLRLLGLSSTIQSTLTEWFLLRWDHSRGQSIKDALSVLPLAIRNYISLELHHTALSKVPLFAGLDKRFFTSLATSVYPTVFLPGQVIVNEGDKGGTMFIVTSGRVAGYYTNFEGKSRLIRWYLNSCVFGRLPTLFYDARYTKTYRAEVTTEVLTLSRLSLFFLARYYPEFATRLQEFIDDAYDPRLGTNTILSPDEEVRQPEIESNARELAQAMVKAKVKTKANDKKGQGRRRKPKRSNHKKHQVPRGPELPRRTKSSKIMLNFMKHLVEEKPPNEPKSSRFSDIVEFALEKRAKENPT